MKVFNSSEFHLSEMTLLQNPYFKANFPNYTDTQLKKLVSSALWHYKKSVFPRERELINGKFETTFRVDSVEWKKDGVRKKGENKVKEGENKEKKESQKKKGGKRKKKEIENESDDSEEIDIETEKKLQKELEEEDEIDGFG